MLAFTMVETDYSIYSRSLTKDDVVMCWRTTTATAFFLRVGDRPFIFRARKVSYFRVMSILPLYLNFSRSNNERRFWFLLRRITYFLFLKVSHHGTSFLATRSLVKAPTAPSNTNNPLHYPIRPPKSPNPSPRLSRASPRPPRPRTLSSPVALVPLPLEETFAPLVAISLVSSSGLVMYVFSVNALSCTSV